MKNGLFVVLAVAWLSWPITSSFAQIPSLSEARVKAELGDARAQHNLGVMYEKGLGVARDDVQAVLWYRKAADQGLAEAQYNLALTYARGPALRRTMPRRCSGIAKLPTKALSRRNITLVGCMKEARE